MKPRPLFTAYLTMKMLNQSIQKYQHNNTKIEYVILIDPEIFTKYANLTDLNNICFKCVCHNTFKEHLLLFWPRCFQRVLTILDPCASLTYKKFIICLWQYRSVSFPCEKFSYGIFHWKLQRFRGYWSLDFLIPLLAVV